MAFLNTVLSIEENSKTAFIQVASGKDGGEHALSPRPLRQRSAMRRTVEQKEREIREGETVTETELGSYYKWVAGRKVTDTMTGDYVQDTREFLESGGDFKALGQRERRGCYEAQRIGQRLRREWRKAGRS